MPRPFSQNQDNQDNTGERDLTSRLLHMDQPVNFLGEVKATVRLIHEDFDTAAFEQVFNDVVDLFAGDYPGYQKCNTAYHDLQHTLDTLLAMSRLIHGVHIERCRFSAHEVFLGLVAALMHDTGYIMESTDNVGTGAKHTQDHVPRSGRFAREYLVKNGYSRSDARQVYAMILCTELSKDVQSIEFGNQATELLGKILGTVDLLGQIASRNYLEKLLLLYRELREGNVREFDSELDLLEKTKGFYKFINNRMTTQLDGLNHCMRSHFRQRWAVDKDVYADFAEKNIQYLSELLENGNDYKKELKRAAVIHDLELR